jgi:hypothetical protein
MSIQMMRISAWRLLVLTLVMLQGCVGTQVSNRDLAVPKGPPVTVDTTKLGQDQAQTCVRADRSLVASDQHPHSAQAAGILEDDFGALRAAAERLRVTVTFRDSNRACAPHLRAGMLSKGHDVLTKTFTEESLDADHKYLAGTVSTLAEKPAPGVVLQNPLAYRYLNRQGLPLTCDYDLMDVMEADGQRIAGESARDLEVRHALNANLPLRGEPPHHVDRVMHGAQAEYPTYLRAMAAKGHLEPPFLEVLKPESPLTVLDHDGRIFRLEEVEDALNFYRCRNVSLPAEWNLQPSPAH